ncbi:MAG: hypothetical protein NZ108_02650, partial [Bacteroidia bacterium]|nr:hypothetical protein [Bacteroidia bacterium]
MQDALNLLIIAFRELDEINLAGIGLFRKVRIPAKIDPEKNIIYPPSETFEFISGSTDGTLFLDWLITRKKIK